VCPRSLYEVAADLEASRFQQNSVAFRASNWQVGNSTRRLQKIPRSRIASTRIIDPARATVSGGGGSLVASGNSFAAPVVAGHLARIVAAHPGITVWQAKTVLAALAANVPSSAGRI